MLEKAGKTENETAGRHEGGRIEEGRRRAVGIERYERLGWKEFGAFCEKTPADRP